MGKFYDAEKTNEYFEQIDTAIATYAEQANAVLSSFVTFAGDDEQKGEQAEAVKELVGTGEKNLVDRMIDIQQQISEAGAHIRESFETGVDAASDALIEEDTLLQIEDSFKGFYKTYDDLGTQIEDIATILQSKFGEYATFERPDFESGREAFKDFCGGFLQECMEKLEEFDTVETSYLRGLDLEGLLIDLANAVDNTSAVFASLDMSDPSVAKDALGNITLDVNGNIYAVDENGRSIDITEALRASLGEEQLGEVRKNLLQAKYDNGQCTVMEYVGILTANGGTIEEIYAPYTDDKGVLREIRYLTGKDENGRYHLETVVDDLVAGREVTDTQLKALSLILENNGNVTYVLFEGKAAEEARAQMSAIISHCATWDSYSTMEGVTDTDLGYEVVTYKGIIISPELGKLVDGFALEDDAATKMLSGLKDLKGENGEPYTIKLPDGAKKISNPEYDLTNTMSDANPYLTLSEPWNYFIIEVDSAGWDVDIKLHVKDERLGFDETNKTITLSHYEDWVRPGLYLKHEQEMGRADLKLVYDEKTAKDMYAMLTGSSGASLSEEGMRSYVLALQNAFMLQVNAPRVYNNAKEKVSRSAETGKAEQLTWFQEIQLDQDILRMSSPDTVLDEEELRYGKDVVKYYKMTHPNAQFLSNVYIDPLYYDPDTKGVTEAGKQRYADAWTNYTSETPGGFSVFAEATDPGYQQFLQVSLLQEKTAGGMTAMGRGFVRPMEKLGGMLDTAFCGIGRVGQDIVYELGSPFVESLFGYDAANAFYDGIYGTQEEQKRQQELQAATGTYRDMLYNNAVTQYPVYTKGGEVAGQVVLIAASTVTLNGLGLTTAVESGIAPYVTEMGKTVLSMTATETLAETIVLISPNMDYNIKHGMSWNRALNVAAAEEVECLIMNLAGNFLGYGIDNVLTGEKRVVMVGDTGTNSAAANVLDNMQGTGKKALLAEDDFVRLNRTPIFGQEYYDDLCERYGTENVKWVSEEIAINRIQPTISVEHYRKYKHVYENDLFFNQSTGEPNWPPNDGFLYGVNYDITYPQGTRFSRYGRPSGEYLGGATDSFEMRSLAPYSRDFDLHYYELIEEMTFTTGEVAPWFGFSGGGEQFILLAQDGRKYTINEMLQMGIIEEVFP